MAKLQGVKKKLSVLFMLVTDRKIECFNAGQDEVVVSSNNMVHLYGPWLEWRRKLALFKSQ